MPKKKIPRKNNLFSRLLIFSITTIVVIIFGFVFFYSDSSNCANSISCIRDLSGKYDPSASEGQFLGRAVSLPQFIASENLTPVLGDKTTSGEKHIYIDLKNQKLYAFEGNTLIYNFPVSTGKWGRTPTGDFRIWIKLRYTRMTGGNSLIGTYYDLPNVPYTMFFYNSSVPKSMGYGIHGAYWHNNFGHPMSHGCVNMREEDVAQVYAWADPVTQGYDNLKVNEEGTLVTIYGQAPTE